MKLIFTLILMTWAIIILAVTAIGVSPYYYYEKSINGKLKNEYLSFDNFDKKLLTPSSLEAIKPIKSENNLVWNNFHFEDFLIPLPVKNPFYLVAPILKYKDMKTQLGIRLFFPEGRTISQIYFLKQSVFPNALRSQKLFKLPLIKNALKRVSKDKLWKDIFNKKLGQWKVPYDQMPYNLYVLQMRSLLFPKEFIDFKLVEDDENTAIIRLESENKDFKTELILKKVNSVIYSYLLLSRKGLPESKTFRSRFLNVVKYRSSNSSLSDIIYREFQALDYQDKVDHLGMLYLLSAWSHQKNKKDIIQEMITYLERGNSNENQLTTLYKYSVKRWGTTFTERHVEGLFNEKIKLKRSIELEEKANLRKLENEQREKELSPPKELTEKEKIQLRLQKAKRNKGNSKTNSMRIN